MTGRAKALRHRVQCLLCNAIFGNDYVKRHTAAHHKDYLSHNRLAPTRPFSGTFSARPIDCFLANRGATVTPECKHDDLSEESGHLNLKYRRTDTSSASDKWDDVSSCADDDDDVRDQEAPPVETSVEVISGHTYSYNSLLTDAIHAIVYKPHQNPMYTSTRLTLTLTLTLTLSYPIPNPNHNPNTIDNPNTSPNLKMLHLSAIRKQIYRHVVETVSWSLTDWLNGNMRLVMLRYWLSCT